MTPAKRNAARERLRLFLHAEDRSAPVSRAELAGYLADALKQIDDDEKGRKDDEALMRRALRYCDPGVSCPFEEHHNLRRDLRARLGEAASEHDSHAKEASDGEA